MKSSPPKFPLIMGLIAVAVIVPLTIYLVLQRTQLLSEAGTNENPKFIIVTNETNDGFTIAWVTTKATQGTVILPFEGLTIPGKDNTKTHVIEMTGLEAGKRYQFKLLSELYLMIIKGLTMKLSPQKSLLHKIINLSLAEFLGKKVLFPCKTDLSHFMQRLKESKRTRLFRN